MSIVNSLSRKNKHTFKDPGCGPQQLLIIVASHYPHELHRTLTGQDDKFALLVSISKNLQAVCHYCQELDVVPLKQSYHLLQSSCQADSHLGALLVKQQVVQSGDSVEQH